MECQFLNSKTLNNNSMSTNENYYPPFPPTPFYYNFKGNSLQYVYVGEIYGTTFLIAANMKHVEEKKKQYLVLKDIRSLNIGTIGAIKFSIKSIEKKTIDFGRNSKNQRIVIKLRAFDMRDVDLEPLKIKLPKYFDINKHELVIDFQDSDISGLEHDALFLPNLIETNNERSCNIKST